MKLNITTTLQMVLGPVFDGSVWRSKRAGNPPCRVKEWVRKIDPARCIFRFPNTVVR